MLQPKRVRYRRPQDGRGNKGNAHRGTTLAFGSFGIKTMDAKWIDSRQIEAARVAINRYMNREGQVWIRIFPDVKVRFGSASSPTNPSLASLLMSEWVKVRVIPQDGLHLSHRAVSSLK